MSQVAKDDEELAALIPPEVLATMKGIANKEDSQGYDVINSKIDNVSQSSNGSSVSSGCKEVMQTSFTCLASFPILYTCSSHHSN